MVDLPVNGVEGEDRLVAWGWNPGGDRAAIPVPRDVFIAKFKEWAVGGGPCPND